MTEERREEIRRTLVQREAYPLGNQEVVDLAIELLSEVDRLERAVEASCELHVRRSQHACQCTRCEP